MIPKKIHYIWLGNKPLNNTSKLCINSWRRVMPEYEIKEWNADNLELNKLMEENIFLKKCIKNGLWAFASDYLRIYILMKEGGIYMDTDVEAIREFGNLLEEHFFVGLENNDYIGTGVIGAEKESSVLKKILDFYSDEIWKVDYFNNPIIFKKIFDDNNELKKRCKILPIEVFSPYNPCEKNNCSLIGTNETLCIHWYNADWGLSRRGYVFLQTKHYHGMKKALEYVRKNIGYFLRKVGWKKTNGVI